MSLYNFLFGKNSETPVLLGMLNLNMEYFGRFRDVELVSNAEIIRVFTRTGGNNRDYFMDNWTEIRNHELYIKDYDDDFDDTYAYIEFKVPEQYKETAKKMFKGEPETFKQKFDRELEEMDKPDSDARKRAEHIANSIMGLL